MAIDRKAKAAGKKVTPITSEAVSGPANAVNTRKLGASR